MLQQQQYEDVLYLLIHYWKVKGGRWLSISTGTVEGGVRIGVIPPPTSVTNMTFLG